MLFSTAVKPLRFCFIRAIVRLLPQHYLFFVAAFFLATAFFLAGAFFAAAFFAGAFFTADFLAADFFVAAFFVAIFISFVSMKRSSAHLHIIGRNCLIQ